MGSQTVGEMPKKKSSNDLMRRTACANLATILNRLGPRRLENQMWLFVQYGFSVSIHPAAELARKKKPNRK